MANLQWNGTAFPPKLATGVARTAWLILVAATIFALADLAAGVVEQRPGAWTTVATAAALLAAALVASIAGFAFAAVAGGALAFLQADPVSAVRTVVVCSLAIQLYGVWKLRAAVRWRPLLAPLAGGVATLPLGVWLLLRVDVPTYEAVLGALLILYGACLIARTEPRVVRGGAWSGLAAGAIGGLAGGLAGLPGASVTIWCSRRGWDKLQQRAVYQPFILVMQLLTLGWLHGYASIRVSALELLHFVPFAVFGAIGGLALFHRLSDRQFRWATGAILLLAGASLLFHTR